MSVCFSSTTSFFDGRSWKKCKVISSPYAHTFFFNQKCCFVLIRCPLPRKKNLLLIVQQLPQTLNKRIKENCLGCLALLEALGIMCELQCVTRFYSNTNVFTGRLRVRQTELIFQPKLNLHSTDDNIASFKAALPLGIPHIQFKFSCSLNKRMFYN